MIEKGRHLKIEKDERYCPFCPYEIETEKHFILFYKARLRSLASQLWKTQVSAFSKAALFRLFKDIRTNSRITLISKVKN